ncbi:unnamed protein product [Candidula unifasciata]|uniref:G-protein coupled receptors family 1 profile domain-containing protein n=1 Tax=Candidula unifasciata TaxID=100452 RepID=A0A8S3ZFC2_9EUPU|nr:unnamed protein product [Candidula unifasciata]
MDVINISLFDLNNITYPSVNRKMGESFNVTPLGLNRKHTANGRQPLYAQIIIVLMYVLIIIIAVGGNLLFSYVILTRPKMRSVTNLFLLNLAISDIVKAVVCNPFAFMANLILLHWPYGDFMCPLVTYVQVRISVVIVVVTFALLLLFIFLQLVLTNRSGGGVAARRSHADRKVAGSSPD